MATVRNASASGKKITSSGTLLNESDSGKSTLHDTAKSGSSAAQSGDHPTACAKSNTQQAMADGVAASENTSIVATDTNTCTLKCDAAEAKDNAPADDPRITALMQTVSIIQSELTNKCDRKELGLTNAKVSDLTAQVSSLRQELNEVTQKLNDVQQKLEKSEKLCCMLNDQIRIYEMQIDALKKEQENWLQDKEVKQGKDETLLKSSLRADNEILIEKNKQLRHKLDELYDKVANYEIAIKTFKETIKVLEVECENMRSEVQADKKHKADLEAEIAKLRTDSNENADELIKSQRREEAAEKKNQQLRECYTKLTEKVYSQLERYVLPDLNNVENLILIEWGLLPSGITEFMKNYRDTCDESDQKFADDPQHLAVSN